MQAGELFACVIDVLVNYEAQEITFFKIKKSL